LKFGGNAKGFTAARENVGLVGNRLSKSIEVDAEINYFVYVSC